MVPPLSTLSLALCTKMLFRGMYLHNETKIRKRRAADDACSHQYLVTDILNAHITKKFEKTYRIINLRRYPPQSANETRKCAGTPNYYTTTHTQTHTISATNSIPKQCKMLGIKHEGKGNGKKTKEPKSSYSNF